MPTLSLPSPAQPPLSQRAARSGRRTTRFQLRARLSAAETYAEWREAALALDELTGAADWRRRPDSRHYDYAVIQLRLERLQRVRAGGDLHDLLFALNEGIHGNMAGMGNPALYDVALGGTKHLIEEYVAELDAAIHQIAEADERIIPFAEKLDFLRRARHCYGASALMLSGGGSLGPFHLGVTRALVEQELLPTVISGASAGAFVAGILGTHDNGELRALLNQHPPLELYEHPAGTRLTAPMLYAMVERLIPDLTFQEAFERTGRQINISIAPREVSQRSRLMNAITSPNVFVRSAVLASCAIPGVFPPVALEAKDAHGARKAYLPSRRWVDGSVADDLPAQRLMRLYGVNHFIASMINPFVLWTQRSESAQASPFVRALDAYQHAGREWLKATYPFTMNLIRDVYPLNAMTRMWYSVVTQDYAADVTLSPRQRLWNPYRLLQVMPAEDVDGLIHDGERVTWRRIEMIRVCTRLSRTLDGLLDRFEHVYLQRSGDAAKSRLIPSPEPSY